MYQSDLTAQDDMLAAQDDMLGCTGAYQYIDPSIQTHAGLIMTIHALGVENVFQKSPTLAVM